MITPRIHRGPLRRALILENPDPALDEGLAALGFELKRVDRVPGHSGLLSLLEEYRPHLLFKRSRTEIDADVLDASPELFAVMLCCIGDDSVDKVAAAARGVLVLNDPKSNGRSVAELVIGQLLMGARRIPEAWDECRRSAWAKSAAGRFEVKGRTLGVLGLGHIGKQVARLAEGLGMNILFFDTSEVAQAVGETMDWEVAASFEDLFERSDVVTVHLSAEDDRGRSNRLAIRREHFQILGNGALPDGPRVFINLARGFLFEPGELIEAVEKKSIHHAFVDVFPDEPGSGDESWSNPYEACERIHCTPHIGAATRDAQPRIARKMVRTTQLLSQRGTVEDCVFAPRRRIDVASSAESPYILAVVHADARGTKKAVDDAIYSAGVSNLQSAHRDFARYGVAYDLSVLDRGLSDEEVHNLIEQARALTGREDAIRAVRQIRLE